MADVNPQTPEEIKALANELDAEGEVPTHENSVKKAAPEFDPSQNSPAPVADASC